MKRASFLILAFGILAIQARAGEPEGPAVPSFVRTGADRRYSTGEMAVVHRFLDRQNVSLIALATGLRAADVLSTRELLRRGGREYLLPARLVDSTPAFAAYSAGAVAVGALAMYAAHRTGHHRIERGLGWLHVGFMSGLVANNTVWIARHRAPGVPQSVVPDLGNIRTSRAR
jgi:hypothetical protein